MRYSKGLGFEVLSLNHWKQGFLVFNTFLFSLTVANYGLSTRQDCFLVNFSGNDFCL